MIGAWSLRRVRAYIAKVLSSDVRIEENPNWSPTKAYIVTDAYRPNMKWYGRTPAEALRNSGFWLPEDCCHYDFF